VIKWSIVVIVIVRGFGATAYCGEEPQLSALGQQPQMWWIGARTTHRGGDKVGENVKCHFCDLLGMAVFKCNLMCDRLLDPIAARNGSIVVIVIVRGFGATAYCGEMVDRGENYPQRR
jgi:hypothetical protein